MSATLELLRNEAGRPVGRLLRGEDDGHPFEVRVPLRCRTVEDAIDWLRPDGVFPDDPRQGDLWFVREDPPQPGFEDIGKRSWRETHVFRFHNESIAGTRHVAEEFALVEVSGSTAFVGRRGKIRHHAWQARPVGYAKGKISHPEHGVLVLEGWHRVVPRRGARLNMRGLLVGGD